MRRIARRTHAVRFPALVALGVLACGSFGGLLAQEPLPPAIIVERNVMVPMRDGVKLATFIRRPETNRKVPAILSRTPYNAEVPGKLDRVRPKPGDPANHYAIITQDTRGRYASEGEFYPMANEGRDGYDTIEWIAKQPWCDGNVGMTGGSYVGFTQLAAAMERPPHLKALWAQVAPADMNHGVFYYGGAMRMELAQGWMIDQAFKSQRVLRKQAPPDELARWDSAGRFGEWCWHLPLADPGAIALGGPSYARAWSDFVDSWEQPQRWDPISAVANAEKFTVPVMLVAGWYDIFSQANLDLWAALRARGGSELTRKETRLIVGPWVHGCRAPTGVVSFDKGEAGLQSLSVEWFDRWLRGRTNASAAWAPLRYFVMHGDSWVDAGEWPPKDAVLRRYYLHGDPAGRARSLSPQLPATGAPPSTFTYDPRQPARTLGGNNLTIARGIQDHWPNSQRYDVLGFETAPLEKDLTVAGRVRVRLVASSSAPDTDFTAMLIDVRPGRTASERAFHVNVLDGIVRARYRNGRAKAALLEPNKPVELDVDLWSTAYTFKAGHRIRLDISSSNFPRFDRNLNTADAPGRGTGLQKADNTVFHDAGRLSFVELPVAP
jgi:hypothetical protein